MHFGPLAAPELRLLASENVEAARAALDELLPEDAADLLAKLEPERAARLRSRAHLDGR